MVSLMSSASLDSLRSSTSQAWAGSQYDTPPRSPARSVSSTNRSVSSTSSRASLDMADDENVTINAGRVNLKGKEESQDDLRLLAISTNITELTYTISDIQTRIFEIQELRHQSQTASDASDASGTSSVIDKSLSDLDERLETVQIGIKAVNDSMEPLLATNAKTPTQDHIDSADAEEEAALLRKHASLLGDWEGIQKDSEMLRDELREDKWLTVFRTVTEQADGMMASLEKAVNRCQDFIGLFDSSRHSLSRSSSSSLRSEASLPSLERFTSLSDTFAAKKKHYMPATSKVLAILDKGVQDRVTKNGECLRRHAESTERWRKLQKQIARTDADMETVRHILEYGDAAHSEAGSSASGRTAASTKNGYLATPPGGSGGTRHPHRGSTIGRSMSPLRKLGRILRGGPAVPQTPDPPATVRQPPQAPSSEPIQALRRQRTSIFGLRSPAPPATPNRPSHKYSQSFTPDATPPPLRSLSRIDTSASSAASSPGEHPMRNAPKWNGSTKVDEEARAATIKQQPPRRPSAMGFYSSTSGGASSNGSTPYKRSLSRSSMGSSRPWSPVTSSTNSSIPPIPNFRPPSRTTYVSAPPTTPRSRPRTPSYIPAPKSASPRTIRSPDSEDLPRAFSPYTSPSRGTQPLHADNPSRPESRSGHPPRPPSRSMIPVPSVQLHAASRPGTVMSQYRPESVLSHAAPPRLRSRPSADAPPSSFRDGPRTPTRAPSRSGAQTPGAGAGVPDRYYTPANAKDPLDAMVASIVNGIAHAFTIVRSDLPQRGPPPPPGQEIRAQYTFSSALTVRKVLNVKLTSQGRLMCRVGGGWEDLRSFLIAHPTSM